MISQTLGAGVRHALAELQQYYNDNLAPLMVRDSILLLLQQPPELVAAQVQDWIAAQFRLRGANAAISDYLYHALKKIHLLAEFQLIEKPLVDDYLGRLAELVLQLCPADERDLLADNLRRLGDSETTLARAVDMLHQGRGFGPDCSGRAPPGGGASRVTDVDVAKDLRRFSLLLERLQRSDAEPAGGAPAAIGQAALLPQLLAYAALSARSDSEFDEQLRRLAGHHIDARPDQIFRALSRALPGWSVPGPGVAGGQPGGAPLPSSRQVEAMHRIIAMAEDPEEGARRFSEMVQAAIEQFNEGSLAQAATMFELAERLVAERRLDPQIVAAVRQHAHKTLAPERLRQGAESPEKHAALRRVLGFFPALAVENLLDEVRTEQRRDRRKLLLALLEVRGAPARTAALQRLAACAGDQLDDPQGFYRRNLVFLLRRIARTDAALAPLETDVLVRLSALTNPVIVVKEAISALGQIKTEQVEQELIGRLAECERLSLSGGELPPPDLHTLLDRACAALTRLGSPNALRTVANHALSRQPAYGDALARLEHLGGLDLSQDGDLVNHLVGALRSCALRKVLGFLTPRRGEYALRLVQALSGTPAPAVRAVLKELAEKHPGQPFAESAVKALVALNAPAKGQEPVGQGLTGDLELFALPSLMQSLAESVVSGDLQLTDRDGRTLGVVVFERGKIRSCKAWRLHGQTALLQLFEKPFPGTFSFRRREADQQAAARDGESLEVLPMVLEGVRRHDELQEAVALAPDDAVFAATGVKPSRPAEEEDVAFLRAVWGKVTGGATPAQCEGALPADSYRVRSLIAHWIEEGALAPQ